MKAETCSVAGSRAEISALGDWVKKTSDHMPGDGNSTKPTRRKLDPELENKVWKICFAVR